MKLYHASVSQNAKLNPRLGLIYQFTFLTQSGVHFVSGLRILKTTLQLIVSFFEQNFSWLSSYGANKY